MTHDASPVGADVSDRTEERVRLRHGVTGTVTDDGYVLVRWPHAQDLGVITPRQRALLLRLADEDVPAGQDDELLATLRAGGWLRVTVELDGRPLYTLTPMPPVQAEQPVPPEAVLSRFAVIRRSREGMEAESPRARCTSLLHDMSCLPDAFDPEPRSRAGRLLRAGLWRAGLLALPGTEGDTLPLSQWSAHELWFHGRSRRTTGLGRTHGRTDWAAGHFPVPPPVRESSPGPGVALHRPDTTALGAGDPPLAAVIGRRRSIRQHDDQRPLTAAELGEFLFRCGRNQPTTDEEHVRRPYPSGGMAYPLEIYPVIRLVAGVEPGLYRYDPQAHRLEQAGTMTNPVRRLLRDASVSLHGRVAADPQVVLVVAARFGRVMWTYREMSYSLILKDVGVLFQTMYLVATAMGLAPCALGVGDAGAFEAATGLDPMVEGSVGEFALGSRLPERRVVS
ncbi:SagB family peptide dehydrogenase [Nonomuraea sp. KM88]|uniref:SagB family peptide dehydrogenase n=1 Tax=Nonomuraea sp. KM88 TaxID=3457427 RepID=UPI003FCD48A7